MLGVFSFCPQEICKCELFKPHVLLFSNEKNANMLKKVKLFIESCWGLSFIVYTVYLTTFYQSSMSLSTRDRYALITPTYICYLMQSISPQWNCQNVFQLKIHIEIFVLFKSHAFFTSQDCHQGDGWLSLILLRINFKNSYPLTLKFRRLLSLKLKSKMFCN